MFFIGEMVMEIQDVGSVRLQSKPTPAMQTFHVRVRASKAERVLLLLNAPRNTVTRPDEVVGEKSVACVWYSVTAPTEDIQSLLSMCEGRTSITKVIPPEDFFAK